jgi:hypothetical protein
MTVAKRDESEKISLPCTTGGLLLYFLGLGTVGFGGPIALVAYMQRDLVDARIHSMASTPSGIRPGFRATRIYSWVRGARQHKVMSVRAAKSVGDSRSITRRLAGLQLRVNEYVTPHRTAA